MPDFRIAYLSYDGLTDPLGQSQILPYLLGLEAKGFEFVIFSFEKPGAYLEGRSNIDATLTGKKITWIPLKYHKRPPVLSTVLDICFLWRALKKEHKRKLFSIVHCRSYITSLIGMEMKRRKGIKFIFDMRGFWADERVEGGLWNLKKPVFKIIYNFFKKKEKEFLTKANHIISLTQNAKQKILSWGLNSGPITVIPTCVDLDLFDPKKITKDDQEKLRKKLGIKENDFILLYLGSLGTWYLYDDMIACFEKLKKKIPNAKFLFVTSDLDKVEKRPDLIAYTAMRHEVPLCCSLAHIAIFFYKPTFSRIATSPTKMGEVLAMGLPVITNEGWGDREMIFKDRTSGYYLWDSENQSLPESLFSQKNRFEENRDLAAKLFDLTLGIDKYLCAYRDILNSTKN